MILLIVLDIDRLFPLDHVRRDKGFIGVSHQRINNTNTNILYHLLDSLNARLYINLGSVNMNVL